MTLQQEANLSSNGQEAVAADRKLLLCVCLFYFNKKFLGEFEI